MTEVVIQDKVNQAHSWHAVEAVAAHQVDEVLLHLSVLSHTGVGGQVAALAVAAGLRIVEVLRHWVEREVHACSCCGVGLEGGSQCGGVCGCSKGWRA